jgi:endonuclease III
MALDLAALVDALIRDGGVPLPALSDPYAIVLHENVGYLVDDERRDALYARLVALAPDAVALLGASHDALARIARDGGMRPEARIDRWRAIAELVLSEADGDLIGTLRRLPIARARKLLAHFPSIGAPGVDRILLFAGMTASPSIESNGLRVLERAGIVAAGLSYSRGYREACLALGRAYLEDSKALRRAYLVLRRHGKQICRRSAPECPRCPVRNTCPTGIKMA